MMGIIDQAAMMLAREAISKTVEFVVGKAEEHHERRKSTENMRSRGTKSVKESMKSTYKD